MCDVVGIQTQMLQVGIVDGSNELAETCQVKLYRESKIERKLWKLVEKQNTQKLLYTFKPPYAVGQRYPVEFLTTSTEQCFYEWVLPCICSA